MAQVEIRWTNRLQFVGTDTTRHTVVMSAADEENSTGAKPSDLLLLALGGCTGVDVVEILRKKRQDLRGLTIQISAEQEPDPPWAFRRIHLRYELRGRGLSARAVEQAVELSEEKYCAVRASLSSAVEVSREIVIEED